MKKRKNKVVKNTSSNFLIYFIFSLWLFLVTLLFFKYHKISLYYIFQFFQLQSPINVSKFLSLFIDNLFSFIISAGIVLNAFFLGNIVIKLFKFNEKFTSLEEFSFSTGLGFGILAYIILFIGLLGFLYKTILYPFWLIAGFLGLKRFLRIFRESNIEIKLNFTQKIFFLLIISLLLFNLLVSFTPEMFYDSLNYHVGVPNYYRVYHRIQPMPYKPYSNFPLTVSMLYTYALILKESATTKLLNWFFGIFIMLGIFSFCVRKFKSVYSGIIASAVFYFTPTIISRSWTATNDIGLALFTFLSVISLLNSIEEKDSKKWLILSSIFAGFSMGSKYTSIFFIFGMFTILIFFKKQKEVILWLIISIAIFLPWPVKNYVYTGNPFHPMLSKFFKVKYPHNTIKNLLSNETSQQSLINKIKKLPVIPWKLSIQGGGVKEFDSPDYYMIGPIYLAFIPLIIFLKKHENSLFLKASFLFLISSYILWGIFSWWKIKYYTPAVPMLSIITGYVLWKIKRDYNNFILIANLFLFILLASNFIFMIPIAKKSLRPFEIFTGVISKKEYLSKSRPGYPYPSFAVYDYINNNLAKNAKVMIFGDAKCFYIRRKFSATSVEGFGLNPFIEYIKNSNDAENLYNLLKKDGYTHLVVNVPEAVRTAGYGNLYFSKKDFEILEEFWKKHIKLIYFSNGVYLYEFVSKNKDKVPLNTPKLSFKYSKMNEIENLLRGEKWRDALKILKSLMSMGISDDRIHYLTAICNYYIGDLDNAKRQARIAYNLNQKKEYNDFINFLERK